MPKFPEIKSWLTVAVQSAATGQYQHLLAREDRAKRDTIMPRLKAVVADAHEDARQRLRDLLVDDLDPLAAGAAVDPADGYPERLHVQTLKGYFGEIFAGVVAENMDPFGFTDWEVPAHLFRFHLVEFQQLDLMNQVGGDAALRPGRTGDDCLAFRRDKDGQIIATLFCEAKCSHDHDAGLIGDAHEKSSLRNLRPVDLAQVIEVLRESAAADAPQWIRALRILYFRSAGAPGTYERLDQITYVCGRHPKQNPCWISPAEPHEKYTGGRRLHVAEIHLTDVEELIQNVYSRA